GGREPHRRVGLRRHRHRRDLETGRRRRPSSAGPPGGRDEIQGQAGGLLVRPKRVIPIVMDSGGCGGLPRPAPHGDGGSNTLRNTARFLGGMTLPYLQKYGIGNLTTILGVPPVAVPAGGFGKMVEASAGKDTTTGHWEMAGLRVEKPFSTFPHG